MRLRLPSALTALVVAAPLVGAALVPGQAVAARDYMRIIKSHRVVLSACNGNGAIRDKVDLHRNRHSASLVSYMGFNAADPSNVLMSGQYGAFGHAVVYDGGTTLAGDTIRFSIKVDKHRKRTKQLAMTSLRPC